MRSSWMRLLVGRGLRRPRSRRRACSIGACSRCGSVLFALSDDWLDAERVVTTHLDDCAEPTSQISVRARSMLRSA